VIPNGVDDDLLAPRDADPELRARWGLGERFVCSYVGTIGMACGLDVVLDAAEALRREGDARFVFLLVGDGARLGELRRRAEERGVAERVVFTGLRPKAEIPRFLAASDACLVHLRKTELFATVLPSKIFEAAGMARPIVCAVPGRAAALVAEAGAGPCIPPEDPAALVAALRALAADPAAARRMGESGRAFVLRHYRRDDLARRYLDVLAALGAAAQPAAAR